MTRGVDPALDRRRDPALPAVRDRRDHPPHADLRGARCSCWRSIYLGGVALIGSLLRGPDRIVGDACGDDLDAGRRGWRSSRCAGVIQRGVDRRFYRAGYDAQAAVNGFSERLREQIDLDALCDELRSVVSGTVQPTHASVWLRASR